MDLGLEGKVAIVTGASRGLGLAAVEALVAEGVAVLAVARGADALERLAAEHPGRVVARACDMRDLAAVEALPAAAIEAFGRLDVVVNNAGIAPARPFVEASAEGFEDVLRVNVVAPGVLARAAGEAMIERGEGGKIVNVASISGIRGKAQLVEYSASKGALVQLTRALASEWARHDIQVNAIAPGGFATEAQDAVLSQPEVLERRVRKIPARRMADPAEFGPLVCFLASPLSSFVTGSIEVIDGGESAKI